MGMAGVSLSQISSSKSKRIERYLSRFLKSLSRCSGSLCNIRRACLADAHAEGDKAAEKIVCLE